MADERDDTPVPTPIELGRLMQIDHLLAVGQLARAKQLAVDQIAAEPSDASSYTALSRVLVHMDDADAAVEAAAQAVRLAPDWEYAWFAHASALLAAGRFSACEQSLLEAIRLDPADGSLSQMYARVLSFCGRSKEALVWAERALELDADDETAHHLFAAMLHRVRPSKWRISEEVARRAVAMNPDDADGFAVLGSILMTRREFGEAERHFRTALEIDPNNSLALEGLAQLVMGKNWFYKPFLSYQLAMMRLGLGAQLLVVASVWALVSVLEATFLKAEPASTLLVLSYLAFCAYTWFALPITRSVLRRIYPWL